ncbi:glycosyltransferase family 4 protein [Candidatus Nomurabacteria bacterium]|nr:glycosyltransferase family 4 protein [Candidatus Nomurabacteria bacterium]
MKKIVIDARGYSTSTGRYTRKLIEYLEELEANQTEREYTILLFPDEFEKYHPTNPRFSKKVADFKHYSLSEQIGFLIFLNKLNADLVHFTMPQQPIFYRGKTVTTIHDLTLLKSFPGNRNLLAYKAKQMVGRFVFRRIGKKSSAIITPTKFTKTDYTTFLSKTGFIPVARINPVDKIQVTYESADVVTSKPTPYPALIDKDFIMYVGQQSNYKNLRRLMQSHQQLLKERPGLKLVLVGKLGEYGEQSKKWAEQQNFKNIVFTGFLESDAQLAWLYKNTLAYVFPSLMEGFGLPALEAMAHGAPVVSSNATCIPEVCGNAAHYFDPEDVSDITRAISEVLEDKKLREDLIKKGTQQVKKYSWKRMAEQTLDIYTKSLKN